MAEERMTAVATLIARLEGVKGPNRELDARLAVLCGHIVMHERNGQYAFFETPLRKGDMAFLCGCLSGEDDAYRALASCHNTVPNYTGSIDAAVRFVEATLPGWTISIQINLGGRSVVSVFDRREPRETGTIHPVPAIALVTAALKAIQAKEEGNG